MKIIGISMKELKKNRLTPAEKWVLERIDCAKPITYPSGEVGWYKNDNWLFVQDFKNGGFLASYTKIWLVLEVEFGLKDNEIRELLTNLLYDYTDNGKLKIKN